MTLLTDFSRSPARQASLSGLADHEWSVTTSGDREKPVKRVNSRFLWYYGSKAIYPDDQPAMLAAIRRMKAVGPQEDDVAALTNAAENCRQNGADCILIGCTEFSLIANEVETDLPVIDTINMLVARILAFSNLRPRELGSEPAT